MKAYAVTDVGQKRAMNQDFVYCNEQPVGILSNLFMVADGMGGHNAGDFASQFCVNHMVENIEHSQELTIVSILEDAIKTTNLSLIEKAKDKSELEGMGTTLVLATIVKHTLYVANIGDSRLYLMNDETKQITQDHSLVEEMVKRGEIKKEEARFHPKKNIITRAIGAGDVVMPDFFEVEVKAGDIVLLCSDGLSNMVEDSVIHQIIKEHREDLKVCADELIRCANDNGGKDNIAVVLVQIENE